MTAVELRSNRDVLWREIKRGPDHFTKREELTRAVAYAVLTRGAISPAQQQQWIREGVIRDITKLITTDDEVEL